MKIVIIGPAYPLRGGLASFDERMARAFQSEGHDTQIYTYALQYPDFLFPGKTQYSSAAAPTDIPIKVVVNSVNPFNWLSVGKALRKEKPELIIIRYWLPFMAPALGTILRSVRKNGYTKTACIADNVIPHERFPLHRQLSSYLFRYVDAFITMSDSVLNDLRQFTDKPAKTIVHPLYDNFGAVLDKKTARIHLQLPVDARIILFFGFIRKYKGLDILLEAMHLLQQDHSDIQLVVAGEFYGDRKLYDEIITRYQLQNVILRTDFIPDSEVKYYLSATDFVVQPYRDATQSGVTPLAYHYEKPMLVTNVGALPEMVPDGKVGVVVSPDPEAVKKGIEKLYALGETHFHPYLVEEKKKYSWEVLVQSIIDLIQTK